MCLSICLSNYLSQYVFTLESIYLSKYSIKDLAMTLYTVFKVTCSLNCLQDVCFERKFSKYGFQNKMNLLYYNFPSTHFASAPNSNHSNVEEKHAIKCFKYF